MKGYKHTITTSVRVNDDIWSTFKSITAEKKETMSDVINELLKDYNEKNKKVLENE